MGKRLDTLARQDIEMTAEYSRDGADGGTASSAAPQSLAMPNHPDSAENSRGATRDVSNLSIPMTTPISCAESELLKLAERVEALTGADREVDEAILEYRMRVDQFVPDRGAAGYPKFAYTASLDAAMTLWGDDLRGQITILKDCAKAYIWTTYPRAVEVKAATPALAATAVALRARANPEQPA